MSYYARYEDTIRSIGPTEEDAMTLAEQAGELAAAWEAQALTEDESHWDGGEFDVTELVAALDLLAQARETWDGGDDLDWSDNDTLTQSEEAVCTLWYEFLGVALEWRTVQGAYGWAAA